MKEKLLELTNNFNNDREVIRKTLKNFQEMEAKVKDIFSRSRDMMNFRENFLNFEQKCEDGIADLYRKTSQLKENLMVRIQSLDDIAAKSDKRLLFLERESTV